MMKIRKVNRRNKERFLVAASSLLIVTVCAMTGVYINQNREKDEPEQIVDFASLENGHADGLGQSARIAKPEQQPNPISETETENDVLTGQAGSVELDLDPSFRETGSDSIVNLPQEEEQRKEDGEQINEEQTGEGQTDPTQETERDEEVHGFSQADTLAWPVEGNVLMNYSMDKTIYFATLDQYKYNPAVVIGSSEGTAVKAPFSGQVLQVAENAEIGRYIILDMGNGYELTLGQLGDVSVAVGDHVKREQTIAKVAKPSKYYSVEGTNVYLKLDCRQESINPMNYLT
ncbi:MAG: M23 family metallopeptidase [Lachnospiraceae bacterium]|nr:M23 family metallopeptidase [Lachnospiraceae bacterium]